MDGKFYVKKIIRSDGQKLNFDTNEIYLAENNTLMVSPDPNTTAVAYTEADGGEMIRQQANMYEQSIKGLIIPRVNDYWTLASKLLQFFKLNFTYKIVYVKIDGSMFAVNNAWISTGLQVVPLPNEKYSDWSVTFTIGDTAWTEYAEDSEGNEIYSNTVTLPLLTMNAGGEIWDSVGLVSDNVGAEWEVGAGGVQTVNIQSTQVVYPVWTVEGPCMSPSLQNNTTDTIAQYNGNIASGQTLVVDFASGVAHLNSALVTRNVEGIFSLAPGANTVGFNSNGGSVESSTISWNNTIN